jgi:hypothetical protein
MPQATILSKDGWKYKIMVRRNFREETLGFRAEHDDEVRELEVGDKIIVERITNDPYPRFVEKIN